MIQNSDNLVSSNRLDIKNPYRLHGLILGVSAIIVGLLSIPSLLGSISRIQVMIDGIASDPQGFLSGSIFVNGMAVPIGFELFVLSVTAIVLIKAIIFAAGGIIKAIKYCLTFFVPVSVPGSIEDANSVINKIFDDRVIETFSKPGKSLLMASQIFSERLRYCVGKQKVVPQELVGSVGGWVFVLILFSIPALIPDGVLSNISSNTAIPSWIGLQSIPFPKILLFVFVIVSASRIVSVISTVPHLPNIMVKETREHYETTGNPSNFFNHIQQKFQDIRVGSFLNRNLLEVQPSLRKMNRGETDDFSADLIVETQPMPVDRGLSLDALALDLGGAVLKVAGFASLLIGLPLAQGNLIGSLLLILSGMVTLSFGSKLLGQGYALHKIFRFRSQLFRIKLQGTYTVSTIGLGDGRGGQVYSERAMIQSDTYNHMHGSQIITQCEDLEGPRYVLDAQLNDNLETDYQFLLNAMRDFKDTGGRLAAVDVQSDSLNQMANTNAQITAGQKAAAESARLSARDERNERRALESKRQQQLEEKSDS